MTTVCYNLCLIPVCYDNLGIIAACGLVGLCSRWAYTTLRNYVKYIAHERIIRRIRYITLCTFVDAHLLDE